MYSFESHVRYSEIDEHMCLSVPSAVNYLQDCSAFHSEVRGVGPKHCQDNNCSWLLASWGIEIFRLPHFAEKIRVSTWPTQYKGLMVNRNFTICEADDIDGTHPLVRADSRWFMFNPKTGRPLRIPEDEFSPYMEDLAEPLDMQAAPRHIRADSAGKATTPTEITGAHIDTNHHVNNAQYIQLALGALAEWAGAHIFVQRLDVQYHIAAKLGDTIYPHVHVISDARTVVTLDNAEGSAYASIQVNSRPAEETPLR